MLSGQELKMSQAALGVRFEKTPVEVLQQPGPAGQRASQGPCQPYSRRIYREVGTAGRKGPRTAALGQGRGRRDWLKAGAGQT